MLRTVVATIVWLSAVVLPAWAADKTPADLVLVRPGTLPIILTAPHGGREAIPGIEPRNRNDKNKLAASQAWGGFVAGGGDLNTDILAQGMAAEIQRKTGHAPYLVMARFVRNYIDANRPANLAYDDAKAGPYYDYYHAAIRRFIDEVRGKYPAGLLIDVHGQSRQPGVVMRGTQNGRAVGHLLARSGLPAVIGPNGIFGQLEAHGFAVFPANDVPPSGTGENAGLNGGFTLIVYGAQTAGGIDAVQLEFGSDYRQKAVLDKSAVEAGRAVAAFYDAYLKDLRN
ncbi:MAG TPA: hypothetical protein VMH36_18690 [Alphaproteobacteria bacterium]|nr:hypothetical protein [Alphaproteobacteria bacterium]